MKRLINLSFIPGSADCGLLLLRIWFGLTIFLNHGLAKFQNFGGTVGMFQEKMGIPPVFGAAAVIAESVCAVLLVIGLATRWAATFLAVTMMVAFVKVHKMALSGENPGEMAFLYLGGFLAIFLAGAGRFSLDAKLLK
jgi:putative oxidoreductase